MIGKRSMIWGAGVAVVLSAVSGALINELHGGWYWWVACSITVVAAAALSMWRTNQSMSDQATDASGSAGPAINCAGRDTNSAGGDVITAGGDVTTGVSVRGLAGIILVVALCMVSAWAITWKMAAASVTPTTPAPSSAAEQLSVATMDPSQPARLEPINKPVENSFLHEPAGRDVPVTSPAMLKGGGVPSDLSRLYGGIPHQTSCTPRDLWQRLSSSVLVRDAWIAVLKDAIKNAETKVPSHPSSSSDRDSLSRATTSAAPSTQTGKASPQSGEDSTERTTDSDVTALKGFIETLTPVVLRGDTLVVDHSLSGHKIASYRAVLQVGTLVLVDAFGAPITRCYSGNPLTISPLATRLEFVGTKWPRFSSQRIVTPQQPTRPVRSFELTDVTTGRTFTRVTGDVGASDTPVLGPTATAPPPSSPSPNRVSAPPSTAVPPAPQAFRVTSINLRNGSRVEQAQPVEGRIAGTLPEGLALWAFVQPTGGLAGTDRYHPQVLSIDPDRGTWSGTCYFGTTSSGAHQSYQLFIVTLTKDADANMSAYLKSLSSADDYKGWKSLPAQTDKFITLDLNRL